VFLSQWVLRSYDNRACDTERRPDVYLQSDLAGQARTVCDVPTGRPTSDDGRDFGTYPKGSDTLAWLWMKDRADGSSRLLVIATRYREGRHYATSPRDFVPVVEHLERLHAAGYVHGDIRCFNMALGPREGGLFDFDLGGKLANGDGEKNTDVLRYPHGYNHALSDGARLGRANMPITKYHDVYALTKAIFACHVFRPSRNQEGPAELAGRNLTNEDLRVEKESSAKALSETELRARKDVLSDFDEPMKISTHLAELKKFLEDVAAAGWTVSPSQALLPELEKHGLFAAPGDGSTSRPAGSGAATGSPPKQLQKT
jgi:hypothetical protein